MEPAIGLKNTLTNIAQNTLIPYQTQTENEPIETFVNYKKLLFGLSWFHSLVNERRRFGRIGWNAIYQFSDNDLKYSD